MAKRRIYRVTFNKYTDSTYTSVYSKELDKYITSLYEGSLLIPDHGIEHYMKFGDGIKTLDFVGYMDTDYLIPPNYKLSNCFKKKEIDINDIKSVLDIKPNINIKCDKDGNITDDSLVEAIDNWLSGKSI